MAARTILRFFPSLLIAMVIVLAVAVAEQQNRRVVLQEKTENVGSELDNVRSRFERLLNGEIQDVSRLAASFETLEGLQQPTFDRHVANRLGGRPEVLRVELAPDFVVSFVHPLDGNRARLGLDLREQPHAVGSAERMLSTRSARLYGPFQDQNGVQALAVLVPVLSSAGELTVLEGILSVMLDLDLLLQQAGVPDPENEIDYAILFEEEGGAGGSGTVVKGNSDVIGGAPVSSEIVLPQAGWTILARPVGGWEPTREETLLRWGWLVLLGGLVFVPAFAANWYAVARRRMVEELEAAQERLSGVVQNIPGAVVSYTMPPGKLKPSAADRIEFVNRESCREIWGVEASEAEANVMVLWSQMTDDHLLEEFFATISESAEAFRPWHHVWPTSRPDGSVKWLDGRGHPIRQPDGAIRWYALIVDATADIERTAELERQQEMAYLAQKNDSIGKLTGGVAHDFNNLLAVVMGNQELLREELKHIAPDRPELFEFVQNTLQATERGADLTRKMLSFAQRARLEPAVLALNDIVRETYTWAGRTMPESIHLETRLEASLPQVRIDRGSAESALLNLMVNARDAMPGGGTLCVETSTVQLAEGDSACEVQGLAPGPYVRLVVSDTGNGIAPEILPRIFEPFFSTKPPTAGSGLGLSMVQGFMEQSGGSVRITSEPDEGTAVELLFRAQDDVVAEETVQEEPVERQGGKARILLAEDEYDVRKVLAHTLSRAGYELVEVPSGDAAFETFKQSPDFDLLLTDIVMPGSLQGTDLASAIRCMSPELPVIFLSGYATDSDERKAAEEMRDIRLTKPVARNELVAAIEDSLGHGPGGRHVNGLG
ncbi:response regulator [Tropicimonas sp. TH_r6]|uniref:response regulator n=1 Tax=Tropicimonas sp. TH_r6 TaxID=3082085 RepID=UPI002953DFE6|nr:response regulator [Tropicimonas sp. TH_r6]MDV7144598.1 response regulator [Tropicimonas sp. TH_r6]